MTLRIDKDGPHVTLQPDRRPDTHPRSRASRSVLGLAAGVAEPRRNFGATRPRRPGVVADGWPRRNMSGCLDEVLTAHGGLDRWRAVTALIAHGRFGGLLRSRFPGNRMANVTARVELAEQRTVFYGFPQQDQQAVFDRGDVRIETRDGELINAGVTPAPPSLVCADSVATSAGTLSMSRTSPDTRGGTTFRHPCS